MALRGGTRIGAAAGPGSGVGGAAENAAAGAAAPAESATAAVSLAAFPQPTVELWMVAVPVLVGLVTVCRLNTDPISSGSEDSDCPAVAQLCEEISGRGRNGFAIQASGQRK